MNTDHGEESAGFDGWMSRRKVLTIALGLATLLAIYVCYRIIKPFIPSITVAVAIAVATKGVQSFLTRHVRSPNLAAILGAMLVTTLIVVPVGLLIAQAVQEIATFAQSLGTEQRDWRTVMHVPPLLSRAIGWIQENANISLSQIGQAIARQASALVAGSVNVATQLVIMLFVLFFLYRDRESALQAVRTLLPLSKKESDGILGRIEDTIRAVVNGSLTVAFVQALLAGTMYTLLGVPAALIWASATFIMALVPVFGTFMVWGPIAVYLLLTGSWVKGVILIGWGALAVGMIDNLLYPYLVGNRLRLHTTVSFFSIIGGIALFGPVGLILGPVAVAITLGLLEVWSARTGGQPEDLAPLTSDS